MTGASPFEWACPYGLVFPDKRLAAEAHGADAIQALYSALRQLRSMIERFNRAAGDGATLVWEGGMSPGDLGLPGFE